MLTNPARHHEIQGYASATSASPGDQVTFYVSTTAPSFRADLYRMGWYGGKGGLLMLSRTSLAGDPQPAGSTDPVTGLVGASWRPSFAIRVPADWPSGMYMVKLTTSTGFEGYVPLVVRGWGGAPILLVHASATEEAYNTWGGESLYQGRSDPGRRLSRAVEVSFDRPFVRDFGAGEFFYWEYQMVRFLERSGYRVDYLTDIDVHEHPQWLLRYRAVLVVGHDEYWSRSMRDGYLSAVAAGVSLGVFAGNTAYRQIRLRPGPTGPDRVEVCYKDAALDPLYGHDNPLVTAFAWRDPPTSWDESLLLGAMYVSTGDIRHLPWVVKDASSPVFAGTGLRAGDRLPGLLGYEEDMFYPNLPHPAGVTVLAASPVPLGAGGSVDANATLYTAPSGARVFNAGTVEWSWGLDSFVTPTIGRGLRPGGFVEDTRPDYTSPAAERITSNLLRSFLRLPQSVPSGAPPA